MTGSGKLGPGTAVLLLAAALAAWPEVGAAGDLTLTGDADGLSGNGRQAPMAAVMTRLAAVTGWTVYLDGRLAQERVDFSIDGPVPASQALRRILAGRSHAMAFSGPSAADSVPTALWVFAGGDPRSAEYEAYSGPDGMAGGDSPAAWASALSPSNQRDRSTRAHPVQPRQHGVNAPVRVTRSPFGSPTIRRHDPDRSPRFRSEARRTRPNPLTRRARTITRAIGHRADTRLARQAHWRDQRNAAIHDMLKHKDRQR